MRKFEDIFGLGISAEQELELIERLIDSNYELFTIVEFMEELEINTTKVAAIKNLCDKQKAV